MLNIFKSLFKSGTFENLNAAAFLSKIKTTPGAVVLDVRTPIEVAGGQLTDAVNIDFQSPGFDAAIEKLDKSKTYFVYCRSGVRSTNACRKMHQLGFKNLINLSGGYISV